MNRFQRRGLRAQVARLDYPSESKPVQAHTKHLLREVNHPHGSLRKNWCRPWTGRNKKVETTTS